MARTPLTKAKKSILLILAFMALVSSVVVSIAVFTDRVNRTTTIQVSSFDDDGYAIERTAPEGYFTAGQTLDVNLKESNAKSENITSQITMTVTWDSPVPDVYPWGNDSAGNAVITLGSTEITYTVNADHSITFTLPETSLNAGSDVTSKLTFQIPDDLASTGTLHFNFDRIELGYAGWSADYDDTKLDALDFSVKVAWNISKTQTNAVTGSPNLDVIAILQDEDTDGKYELEIIKNGSDSNTNKGQMMDWTAKDQTPWADYVIEDVSIDDAVTTIGDYAFAGETGITSIDLPDTITHIGTSSFDGSGLTGELVIPASVEKIETLGFGNLPKVTIITFEHGSDDTLILPDNESEGEGSSGAFYVPSYVPTTINTDNDEIAYEYNWHNDHRKTVPTLAPQNTWYQGTTNPNKITSITFLDYYDPTTTLTEPAWDASEAKDGSVMAYVESDGSGGYKLIIAGNGYGSIYANADSTCAFGASDSTSADAFSMVSTISGMNLLDTSKTTTMNSMFKGCSSLATLDLSHFDTRKVTDMNSMFCDCSTMTSLNISDKSATLNNNTYTSWDTSGVTDMANQFSGCSKLATLDVSHFNTSAVTDTNHMFYNCAKVATLDVDEFDTRAVGDMSFMFAGCESLTAVDVGRFDTQKVTTTESMFINCFVLPKLDVKKESVTLNGRTFTAWDTGAVTTMASMFENCQALGAMDLSSWDATSVTTMYRMFYNCYAMPSINLTNFSTSSALKNMGSTFYQCQTLPSADLSSFTTTGLEDMSSTFFSCYNLTGVDFGSSFDANAVTTIRSMFAYCSGLTAFDFSAFHTSSALQNMYMLFSNCTNLQSINLANLNTSGVTNMSQVFYKCSKLLELDLTMFDTAKVTSTASMFAECPVLHTIYVSYDWSNENNTYSTSMFSNNYDLVGGAGTVYSSNYTDATRALIDGSGGKKGYFTNNIFLSYEDVTVGETVAADLTIKSKVFDDYVSSRYTILSGSDYVTLNTATGVVTGKAKGTAVIQVTLTADNGDTISAQANVNVLAISVTHAELSYEDVYVGSTVEADLDIYPTNHGQCQSIEFEVISGDEYAEVDPDTGDVTGIAEGTAVIQVTIVDGNGKVVTTTGTVNVLPISVTYAELSYEDVYVGYTVEDDLDIYPSNHAECKSIEFEVISGDEYAEVDPDTGDVTGLAEGTAVIQVTIVDANDKIVTTTGTVNVLPISITDATLTYADVYVGSTVDPNLTLIPSPNGGCKSKTYAVIAGSSYASVDSSTGVVKGLAKGTATIQVTIVDKNDNVITTSGTVNVLPISITDATLTYADVYVGSTVDPNLTLIPSPNGGYKSKTYTVIAGSSYASVDSSTGVVKGLAKGTATIQVTIVDQNDNVITTSGTVNVLAIPITSATLTYEDVRVGYTVDPNLTLSPSVNGGYKSKTFAVIAGSSYASVDSSTGVVTGKAEGIATIQVTIVDNNGSTVIATGPVNVINPIPILAAQQTWYTQGGTTIDKTEITSVNFVDSYDTSGKTIVSSWDASAGKAGTITAYVEDDGTGSTYKLTLAGNGYGKIYANANSYDTFYGFQNMTALTGLTANDAAFFDTSDATTMRYMFGSCYNLTSLDVSKFNTENVSNFASMFAYCESLPTIPLSEWDTSSATTMNQMFNHCTSLTSLDVSDWDLSKVEDVTLMFNCCESLPSLDLSAWILTSVKEADGMFQDCEELTSIGDVSTWTFSTNLVDTSFMFNGCTKLASVDVTNWNVSKVTNMSMMFQGCKTLTTLAVDNWDVSSAQNMSNMFYYCSNLSSLNVSNWRPSSAVDMPYMFARCSSLTSLAVTNWPVSTVEDMSAMFYKCSKLATLDVANWATSSLISVTGTEASGSYTWDLGLFEGCSSLATIDISGWDMDQITNNAHMFYNCSALKSLTIPASLSIISPEFAYNCTALTEITFNHGANDALSMPTAGAQSADRFTSSQGDNGEYSDGGAFYVSDYLATTINANNTTAQNYAWATDNRAKAIPVLAAKGTWYTQGDTDIAKSSITSIAMVDSYTPSGTVIDSWDASDGQVGTVWAYVEDDGLGTSTYKLTVAGNGYGRIYANADSEKAFYGGSSGFSKVTTITGFNTKDSNGNTIFLFDTSNVTTMNLMFSCNYALTDVDVSGFDLGNVTIFNAMFDNCKVLSTLDVSNWDLHSATSMYHMFYCCYALDGLDVSDWDVSSVKDFSCLFANCNSLSALDVSSWDTSSAKDMANLFDNCTLIQTLDVSKWNTSNVTSMNSMFVSCTSLASLDVKTKTVNAGTANEYTAWDVGNVTDINSMFQNCLLVPTLEVDDWNTSSIKYMSQAFDMCKSITTLNVSNWDTSNTERMVGTFSDCVLLETIPVGNFNTSKVTSISGMFKGCTKLKTLDVAPKTVNAGTADEYTAWDLSSNTSLDGTFEDCPALSTLDVSNWDTSNVTTLRSTFSRASSLTSLDLSNWDTSKVTTMQSTFSTCSKLASLDVSTWNTALVTSMYGMFLNCSSLTTIDVSSFDTRLVETMVSMFNTCSGLTTLDISNFDTSSISAASKLSNMFYYSSSLRSITLGANFITSADILPTAGSAYGLFYVIDELPLTVINPNAVVAGYDFAADNRSISLDYT